MSFEPHIFLLSNYSYLGKVPSVHSQSTLLLNTHWKVLRNVKELMV